MTCNGADYVPTNFTRGIGIIDFDWSNAKNIWAKQHPMDCEERLHIQARVTKAASPDSHVYVYRNAIKALPWFSSVRLLLSDPAYHVWFLPFGKNITNPHVPKCDNNYSPPLCSSLYHDQVCSSIVK